jgi:hypothetical protein
VKLIIELDVSHSDFSLEDVERFQDETLQATGISVEVGRPFDDEYSEGPYVTYSLSTEYFKVRTEID